MGAVRPTMGPMRSRGPVITLVAVLVAAAVGGGLWWQRDRQERERTDAAYAAFAALASGWSKGDVTSVPFVDPAVRASFAPTVKGLGATPAKATVATRSRTGASATGTLEVSWQLTPATAWTYEVPVGLTDVGGTWSVRSPAPDTALWAPGLGAGQTLTLERTFGARADLLDRAGKPLMPMGDVYPVQLDPTRATPATAAALEKVVDEPAGSLVAKLAAATKAGSRAPIAVVTYRQSDFDARRARLDALKGVIYPRTQQPLAATRAFGQPLLGSFGPVTAEVLTASKGRYVAGDRAGTSGLQGQYDATLAGTPGLRVTASTGKTLFEVAAVPGKEVRTTLDPAVQAAAESAVSRTGSVPSALVAVDIPTGEVTAVANNPTFGFDRALTGRYPPGSTMKVATTYALLGGGLVTPSTKVSCPKNFVVDGRSFHNFEGETLGTPTFEQDFQHSCNTAFIQLAEKLGDGDLTAAAKALGVGAGWAKGFGVSNTFDGAIPPANGRTDKVAAAIGQARDLASPVAMAVLAGSVARGSYVPPVLVENPSVDRTPVPLDPKVVAPLRTMMRLVVTDGTGSALKNAAGGPVSGKTGTAEYGTEVPPKNRVWFIGYQGDVAFAVMVEDGVSGGTVAAPIATRFLDALAAG